MTKLFSESGDINIVLKKEEKSVSKLDAYKIKGHFVLVEKSKSGNDIHTYISAKWHDQHHGIRFRVSDDLRELYELLGSILLNHDKEMDQRSLKPTDEEPF